MRLVHAIKISAFYLDNNLVNHFGALLCYSRTGNSKWNFVSFVAGYIDQNHNLNKVLFHGEHIQWCYSYSPSRDSYGIVGIKAVTKAKKHKHEILIVMNWDDKMMMGMNFEKDTLFNTVLGSVVKNRCDSFSGFKKIFSQDLPNSIINSATSPFCAQFRVFLHVAVDSGLDKLGLKTLIKSGNRHEDFVIEDADCSNCIDNIMLIVLFLSSHSCSNPGCDGFSYMKCGNCRVVHYCNKECQESDWVNHRNYCYELKCQRRERKYIFKSLSDVLSKTNKTKQFDQIKSTCKVIQAKMLHQNRKFLTTDNPISSKIKEEYLRISGSHVDLKDKKYLSLLSKYRT